MKYWMFMFLLLSTLRGAIAQNAKELQLTANVSESGCAGTRHTVAVEAHGGKAPYTFKWSDSRTGNFRNDLTGGTYTCTVSDSQGKVAKKIFTLSKLPQELTATIRQEKTGDKTLVQVEARGGEMPYYYYWVGDGINIEQTQLSNRKLNAGQYQVVVQDQNGCPTSVSFSISK